MQQKIKAISLLSGGLDSSLAVKALQKKGVEVVAITFTTPFFGAKNAEKAAKELGVRLIVKDITKEHLKMLKNPAHGYGKNMNPCIDCHGLMLKKAKKIMQKEKAQFVATGEVLGQRPMSQNKDALKIVEKISGLEGQLVRPLGELGIQGRSRKKQIELAKKWGIKQYPSPAGGCLLTDPGFSTRLKELLTHWPKCNENDIELLKYGRHFWQGKIKIIIGRNQEENNQLVKLANSKDILLELKDFSGPVGLISGQGQRKALAKAASLVRYYSTKARYEQEVAISWALKNDFSKNFCQNFKLRV